MIASKPFVTLEHLPMIGAHWTCVTHLSSNQQSEAGENTRARLSASAASQTGPRPPPLCTVTHGYYGYAGSLWIWWERGWSFAFICGQFTINVLSKAPPPKYQQWKTIIWKTYITIMPHITAVTQAWTACVSRRKKKWQWWINTHTHTQTRCGCVRLCKPIGSSFPGIVNVHLHCRRVPCRINVM